MLCQYVYCVGKGTKSNKVKKVCLSQDKYLGKYSSELSVLLKDVHKGFGVVLGHYTELQSPNPKPYEYLNYVYTSLQLTLFAGL